MPSTGRGLQGTHATVSAPTGLLLHGGEGGTETRAKEDQSQFLQNNQYPSGIRPKFRCQWGKREKGRITRKQKGKEMDGTREGKGKAEVGRDRNQKAPCTYPSLIWTCKPLGGPWEGAHLPPSSAETLREVSPHASPPDIHPWGREVLRLSTCHRRPRPHSQPPVPPRVDTEKALALDHPRRP